MLDKKKHFALAPTNSCLNERVTPLDSKQTRVLKSVKDFTSEGGGGGALKLTLLQRHLSPDIPVLTVTPTRLTTT